MEDTMDEDFVNCSMPYSEYKFVVVAIVNKVAACVSLLACCFIAFLIIILKRWSVFRQRLVLYLTASALLLSVATVLNRLDMQSGGMSNTLWNFCVFSGFFLQVTAWMLFDSIVSITLYVFLRIVCGFDSAKYEWVYFLGIFFVPFLFNWIPFISLTYGRDGVWCWIRSYDFDTCEELVFGRLLQFCLWFAPVYLILLILVVLYTVTLILIHRKRRLWTTAAQDPSAKKRLKKLEIEIINLLAYPLIYFVLSIFPFINAVFNSLHPLEPRLVLWYLTAVLSPLQGVFISLAFTLHSEVRRRLSCMELKIAISSFCKRDKAPAEYNVEECVSDSIPHYMKKWHSPTQNIEED